VDSKIKTYAAEELLGPLNAIEKKNAPATLYTMGNVDFLCSGARVSIVGSREPSKRASDAAAFLTSELVSMGIVIVSGLAEGIDTIAHTTTLRKSGRTIAVLGTPLNESYPAKNRQLQEQIGREHLLISQFPLGIPVRRSNFPMRNRTMALISNATIIVEAGNKSGSLHQGWEALRLGRPLFFLSSLLNDPILTWPAEMMNYGAEPLPLGETDFLLEVLPDRNGERPSELTL